MSISRCFILAAACLTPAVRGHAQTSQARPFAADLVAVFAEHPLADSAVALLARDGFRVADRSPDALARAQRERRQLDPARLAVVVSVRFDTLARAPIVVAELLNVETLSRVSMASARWPERGQPWGDVLAKVVRQVMTP